MPACKMQETDVTNVISGLRTLRWTVVLRRQDQFAMQRYLHP